MAAVMQDIRLFGKYEKFLGLDSIRDTQIQIAISVLLGIGAFLAFCVRAHSNLRCNCPRAHLCASPADPQTAMDWLVRCPEAASRQGKQAAGLAQVLIRLDARAI